MRVISFNLNGIRSAARKGFFTWLAKQNADVVCLQEIKAQVDKLDDPIFRPLGYHAYYYDAQKSGYSGVGLYCRQTPKQVKKGLGWPHADDEGRFIQADFDDWSIASLYMPSGTSGEVRQAIKFDFLERFITVLKEIKNSGRPFIICGDWNIAHQNIDLKNWRSNQVHSGFLPQERAWIDRLFKTEGFVDAFRVINQEPDQYTWWSHRGQAWTKNVGWRIDYQIVTPHFSQAIKSVSIYKEQRFSDHAPLIIDYEWTHPLPFHI